MIKRMIEKKIGKLVSEEKYLLSELAQYPPETFGYQCIKFSMAVLGLKVAIWRAILGK